MKFDEKKAKQVIQDNGLSWTTYRVWKNRGVIPDFWTKKKVQKSLEEPHIEFDCEDPKKAAAMLFCIIMRGPARKRFRPLWERKKFNKQWRDEFNAELRFAAIMWQSGLSLRKSVKIMHDFCKLRPESGPDELPQIEAKIEAENLPDELLRALAIYDFGGFEAIRAEYPEALKVGEKKLRKAFSAFAPKLNKYTRKKIGQKTHADLAREFQAQHGGQIRFTKRGSIYVELPNGAKYRFSDHETSLAGDLQDNFIIS